MPGNIPEDLIDEIKKRVNILDVVSDFVSLKKAGANYKGLCPFHSEKTPSFTVNEEKQIFHCFGCGIGGNAINFLMKAKGMTFPDALRELAGRVGVSVPSYNGKVPGKDGKKDTLFRINDAVCSFYHRLLAGSVKGRTYLEKRGLGERIISDYRLGYGGEGWDNLTRHLSQKGLPLPLAEELGLVIPKKGGGHYDRFRERVIFPILDLHSRVVGFGGRSIDGSEPKYLNSPESAIFKKSDSLYGLAAAGRWIREADEVLIVEGYMDLLSLHQAGIKNSVATLGTALTSGHLRLLKRLTRNVITVFDADEAGVKATLRIMDLVIEEGVRVKVFSMPEGHDPDTFVREVGADGFKKEAGSARSIMEFFIDECVRGRDTKELKEKIRATDAVLPYIIRLSNEIERSHYLKILSEKVGIGEEILAREMRKRKGGAVNRLDVRLRKGDGTGSGTGLTDPDIQWRAERSIIRLAIKYPELRGGIRESGVLKDYRDEGLKGFGERLLSLPEDADVMDNLELDEDKGLYSRLLMETHECDEPEKELMDCIRKLRMQSIKREKEGLRKEMEEAAQKGDEGLLMELRERHRKMRS